MNREELLEILSKIVHPGRDRDIVSLGMVENPVATGEKIQFTLNFDRARDPLAGSIKRAAEAAVVEAHPEYDGKITVFIKEAAPKKAEKPEVKSSADTIRSIIAVSSGKGGVGKSTVTAGLAVALAQKGYKVGILDADIYGPSMPKMFGVEGYMPAAQTVDDGRDLIVPAESYGVKLMSIGFFIKPDDALVWRGAMATNALRQLIHQTLWGDLDFLLIDMPPGTGDVHLTIVHELNISGAVIVTTPQQIALADVVRGIAMFRSDGIDVPVLGIIENMAWFTPAELPDNKYFIFGRDGGKELAAKAGIPLLAQIPLVQSVSEGGDSGKPAATEYFLGLADNILSRI